MHGLAHDQIMVVRLLAIGMISVSVSLAVLLVASGF
jgi:hypothetical protein